MATDKQKLLRIALRQLRKGQTAGSIDSYKAILKLDPDDVKVHNTLGDLYIRTNRTKEGVKEYLWVADYYEKEDLLPRAIAICQKMLKLDPESSEVRLTLADLYRRQHLTVEAKNQLLLVCEFFEKEGRVDEALDACSKLADLDPDNLQFRLHLGSRCEKEERPVKAAREYAIVAEGMIKAGSPAEAGELLDKAIEISPDTAEPRLVKATLLASREEWNEAADILAPLAAIEDAGVPVFEKFARSCLKTGRIAEAIESLEKAREVEPSSSSLNTLLGRAYLEEEEIEKAQSVYGPLIEDLLKEKKLEAAEDLARQLVDADPSSEVGLKQLLDVLRRRGDKEGIKDTRARLAGLLEERDGSGKAPIPGDEIPETGAEEAAAVETAEERRGESAEAVPAEEPPTGPAGDTEEIEEDFLEVDLEALNLDEVDGGGEIAADDFSAIDGMELKEILVEADFFMQQGLTDEAEQRYRKLLALAPNNADIAARLERLLGSKRGEKDKEAEEPLIAREEIEAPGSDPGPVPEGGITPQPEDGAMTMAVGGVEGSDDTSDFSDFLTDLKDVLEGVVPEPAAATAGAQSLSEFFQRYQASIEEQLKEENFETHYNLGVAYKDMGLIEQALEEFRISEKSQTRQVESIRMTALCLRESGDAEGAIAKLEEGIILSETGSDEEKGFWYDLADIHSGEGREDEALEIFQQIFELDPEYRDVAERAGEQGG